MKKDVALLFVCLCAPVFTLGALDWELPVFTLRYELAHGIREDPEEEILLPSSLRNTVSLRIKEAADPALFDLTLRYSLKDYYMAAGDYGYFEVEHEQAWRVSDPLKLGFLLGLKKVDFPEPGSDGWVKDYLSLRAGPTAAMTFAGGTRLDASLSARYDFADNDSRSFQAYVVSTGVSSRLEGWLLSARYRGEFRLPFDQASDVGQLAYNTCSLTLTWDPSK
ncbi:MAG: hypothetical protein ACLQCB_21825 [Spirochaetia bacterium]